MELNGRDLEWTWNGSIFQNAFQGLGLVDIFKTANTLAVQRHKDAGQITKRQDLK